MKGTTRWGILFFSLVFCSCASGSTQIIQPIAQLDELDYAIRDASDYLNNNIPEGNLIVILNIQSDSTALSDYVIDELIANAVNDRIFRVVDRHQLDLIRAEQNFQLSGEVDDTLALSIGNFLGAQTIVSGRVIQVGERYRMTIRALDVQTAQVQGQYNRNISAGETITALMRSSENLASRTASTNTPSSMSGSGSSSIPTPVGAASTSRVLEDDFPSNVTDNAAPSITIPDSLTGLTAQLDWLNNNAVRGGDYTVRVRSNENIGPRTLFFVGRSVTVRLQGVDSMRIISLSSNGSLFTVNSGVTLVLEDNVTLQGRNNNNSPLITVNTGGALIMNASSRITGNNGGGVYVNAGTLTMQGSAAVVGNNASMGGGVRVSFGTFTMQGSSEVSNNTANNYGGVYIDNGTFIMQGNAEILVNTASGQGGGVGINGGNFIMRERATVSGNTASSQGGGVYIQRGAFTMQNGTISGNSAIPRGNGGGVYIGDGGSLTKSGGTIYGSDDATNARNNASNNQGHAVYVFDWNNPRWRNATAGPSMNSTSYGFLEN